MITNEKRLSVRKSEAECAQVRKEFFELSRTHGAALREACTQDLKRGLPAPGTTGVAEFKVEAWPKK